MGRSAARIFDSTSLFPGTLTRSRPSPLVSPSGPTTLPPKHYI
jgi:hypothetical protein